MDGVCAPHGLSRSLGQTDEAHLPFLDQTCHRAHSLLNRRLRVNAVLVVKINHLDAETAQGSVAGRAHIFGPTVDAEEAPVLAAHVSELRRENYCVAPVAYRAPEDRK